MVGSFWPAWATATQSPQQFPWDATDLAYYFVLVTTKDGIALGGGQSVEDMQTFVSLAHKKSRKAIVTIGGWGGSVYFSNHVATANNRDAFAQTIKAFMDKYNFDGVDIDWEFIGRQGAGQNAVRSKDSDTFYTFLRTLRAALGPNKIIGASMPASGITGADGLSLADTSRYAAFIDYITIMAYDMYASAWAKTTGPNAPLYTCNPASGSVQATVDLWIKSGFPACRLLLGVPGYSHTFRTTSTQLKTTAYNGVRTTSFQSLLATQPADPTTTYKGLIQNGWLSSDGKTGRGGFTRYFDTCTQTPFLFRPQSKYWISYDDAESIYAKARYARDKGLAGVNFYDSTGPSEGMYAAARAGLEGKPVPA